MLRVVKKRVKRQRVKRQNVLTAESGFGGSQSVKSKNNSFTLHSRAALLPIGQIAGQAAEQVCVEASFLAAIGAIVLRLENRLFRPILLTLRFQHQHRWI